MKREHPGRRLSALRREAAFRRGSPLSWPPRDIPQTLSARRGGLRCPPQRHGAAGIMRRSGPVGACPSTTPTACGLKSFPGAAGRRGAVRPGAAQMGRSHVLLFSRGGGPPSLNFRLEPKAKNLFPLPRACPTAQIRFIKSSHASGASRKQKESHACRRGESSEVVFASSRPCIRETPPPNLSSSQLPAPAQYSP
jgi:hypothetical protein